MTWLRAEGRGKAKNRVYLSGVHKFHNLYPLTFKIKLHVCSCGHSFHKYPWSSEEKARKAGRHGRTWGLIKHSSLQASACKGCQKPPEKRWWESWMQFEERWCARVSGRGISRRPETSPGEEASRAWSPKIYKVGASQKGSFQQHESWIIKKAEHQRTDAFKPWCWRRLLRVPWTARRSNQSILKEINPEYSLEGLMLKHQYFDHLMRRADSLEKTLMLGKTEGRRRSGRQRMRWLDGITDSMDMVFQGSTAAAVHRAAKSRTQQSTVQRVVDQLFLNKFCF